MKFPVTCINLRRSVERRERIEKLWRPILGDKLSFFEAYDAKDPEIKEKLPPLKCFEGRHVDTFAAAACLASHLQIMTDALERGTVGRHGMAIMEDDAEPVGKGDVFRAVQMARAEVPGLAILVLTPSLFGKWDFIPRKQVAFPSTYPAVRPGTHFVWYSAKGMREYVRRFRCFPDFSDAFCRLPNNGKMGRLARPVARQARDLKSTIGYAGRS